MHTHIRMCVHMYVQIFNICYVCFTIFLNVFISGIKLKLLFHVLWTSTLRITYTLVTQYKLRAHCVLELVDLRDTTQRKADKNKKQINKCVLHFIYLNIY